MTKLNKIGYSLRDVAVIQAPISFQNHRSDVYPFIDICERPSYPIFVAPMASVTDENNYKTWLDNKLGVVIPRSVQSRLTFEQRMELATDTFVSFSLREAANDIPYYLEHNRNKFYYICIDIAHGTLEDLYDACEYLKKFPVEIMTGNVANPEAYSFYAECGVDWMRVGIGGGSRCTSSANVSIHYPMATLLDELNNERKKYQNTHQGKLGPNIIADGGINWFDDIQKAIALGADAVMCGQIFAKAEEACGPILYSDSIDLVRHGVYDYTPSPYSTPKKFREYYGMSTKRAQKLTGGDGNKTAEGISDPVEIEYPVAKWVDNMQSYLRSCMTYTNSDTIYDLKENSQIIILGGSGDSVYRK